MERNFFQEIFHRLTKPWNTAFTGYFILIVIIFAGLGVFVSIWSAIDSPEIDGLRIAQNMATYFMAIIASSIVDLNISWEIENRVSFLIYSILLFVIAVFILGLTYYIPSNYAFIPAILGCILAWLIWVLANAYNDRLNDQNFYNIMRGRGVHGQNWDN